jgi:hypothetical protein
VLEARVVPTVTLLSNFTGMNVAESGGFDPPDTHASVGPTHVGEVVNSAVAFYDKTDGSRDFFQGLDAFFQGVRFSNFIFDPVIIYDDIAGRWTVAALDVDFGAERGFIDVAFSNDSNPLNGFAEKQRIEVTESNLANSDQCWGDYPKIGFNNEAIVFTLNMFGFNSNFSHTSVISVNKAQAYDQNTATFQSFDVNRSGHFTMAAASMHAAPANSPMYFVERGTSTSIIVTTMTNVLSATPIFADLSLTVPSYGNAPPPHDPGGDITNTIDNRMLHAAWRGDTLVAAHNIGVSGEVRARWYQINTGGTTSLTMSGTINPGTGTDTYYPSIDIAANNSIGMTYIQSGDNENMSMYVTGRAATDPVGTMQTPVRVRQGQAVYGGSRAGDYSGIAADPVTGSTFWAANEYATSGGGVNWGTWIGHFRVVNFPPTNVSAGGPYSLNEGGNLTLTGSATDPENDPLTFTWDVNGDGVFGDATGANPTLTWAQLSALSPPINDGPSGINNVRVRVNDGNGNIVDSATTTLTVTNTPPTAVLNGGGTVSEGSTRNVSFANQADPSAADTAAGFRYSYDFNNDGIFDVGNGTTYAGSVVASSQAIPAALLADGNATLRVVARIFDKDGGFQQLFFDLVVNNVPPTATFANNGPVNEGALNAQVDFSNQQDPSAADTAATFRYSYDLDNNGVFDVGDGLTYAGSVTQTSQLINGPFPDGPVTRTVRARIFDKDGGFTELTTNLVIANVPPTATLGNNGPFNEGASGAMVAFANQNDVATADVAAGFRYAYDFNNDGTFEVGNGLYAGSSALSTANIPASFLADGPGVATIRARIIDKDDGFLDVTTNIVLNNVPPTATAPGSNPTGKEGTNSFFNLGSFVDPGVDNPWAITVNWGDGQTDNFNASTVGSLGQRGHVYADNGSFPVQVTVNDGDGGIHASFFNVNVKNAKPQVFSPGTQFGTERLLGFFDVGGFTDLGVNDADWNVQVNWGDNTAVDNFNVPAQGPLGQLPHLFTRDGTFNVTVTVTDADGGRRSTVFQVIVANTDIVITGTDAGGPSLVRIYDSSSNALLRQFNPFPDLPAFSGGVRVAAGDITGDGLFDYIVGTGPGIPGQVRVFDGLTGGLLDLFAPLPGGSPSLTQGVYVAVGDINADGRKDILTGAGGLGQEVSVFTYGNVGFNPATRTLFDRFNAFPGFPNIDGVTVASGDVNGDGRDDIVAGAGPGGPSRVSVFRYTGGAATRTQIAGFQAFETGYRRGIFVAAANLSGDARAEIIVSAGTTSGRVTQDGPNGGRGLLPRVRIFTSVGATFFHTEVQPYPNTVDTGVRVGAIEDGGFAKLFFATGHSVPGQVRKFDGRTLQLIDTLFSDPTFTRGLFVAGSR